MNLPILMSPAGGGGGSDMTSTIIMFGSIFLIFYFMIIRPQQKRAKEREKMITAMKKGDKVVTNSGMYGTIVALEDKIVSLQVATGVTIKFDKAAIGSVVESKDSSTDLK